MNIIEKIDRYLGEVVEPYIDTGKSKIEDARRRLEALHKMLDGAKDPERKAKIKEKIAREEGIIAKFTKAKK